MLNYNAWCILPCLNKDDDDDSTLPIYRGREQHGEGREAGVKRYGKRESSVREAGGSDPPVPHHAGGKKMDQVTHLRRDSNPQSSIRRPTRYPSHYRGRCWLNTTIYFFSNLQCIRNFAGFGKHTIILDLSSFSKSFRLHAVARLSIQT